jgi:hypothetical protein
MICRETEELRKTFPQFRSGYYITDTSPAPVSNPTRLCAKPATNRLSHGTLSMTSGIFYVVSISYHESLERNYIANTLIVPLMYTKAYTRQESFDDKDAPSRYCVRPLGTEYAFAVCHL